MMPKPWEVAGIDQMEYCRWPMKEKVKLLKKMGVKRPWLIQRLIKNFKSWINRPAGGYLLDAYFKECAERRHLEKNYHNVKFDW